MGSKCRYSLSDERTRELKGASRLPSCGVNGYVFNTQCLLVPLTFRALPLKYIWTVSSVGVPTTSILALYIVRVLPVIITPNAPCAEYFLIVAVYIPDFRCFWVSTLPHCAIPSGTLIGRISLILRHRHWLYQENILCWSLYRDKEVCTATKVLWTSRKRRKHLVRTTPEWNTHSPPS